MTWLGHEAAEQAFLDAWNGGRMHHAWLLAGPKGLGKAAFALRAARFLLAQGTAATDAEDRTAKTLEGFDDSAASHLIDAGAHPEFKCLERLENEKTGSMARSISVDQVRAASALLTSTTSISRYRAIIVDSADDLEAAGANALLKSLEEPPANTVFFLVSHNSGRLLPTIRSRCRSLNFRAIGDDVMASWLRETMPDAGADAIASLTALAGGAPARALRFRDSDLASVWRDLELLGERGDTDLSITTRLSQSLSLKGANDSYEAFLELAPTLLSRAARAADGRAAALLVDRWREANRIASSAVATSPDKALTVFELCRLLTHRSDMAALSNQFAAG